MSRRIAAIKRYAAGITDTQDWQFETCQLPYLFEYKSHLHIWPDQTVQMFLNNIYS